MTPRDRRQLLLPFQHEPVFEALDFIAAPSNHAALAWLETSWPEQRLVLWGPAGSGKSHLLHVWARRHGGSVLIGPELDNLSALPHSGLVALDDADAVKPDELLFHLLNTARERGLRLLLSARLPPARWSLVLPDLSSRLRATAAVEIGTPDDALLTALLVRLLAERQLHVPTAIQTWLLTRLPRSPSILRAVVERLDRESLIGGRAISRSLASDVIHSVVPDDEELDRAPEDGQPYLPLVDTSTGTLPQPHVAATDERGTWDGHDVFRTL